MSHTIISVMKSDHDIELCGVIPDDLLDEKDNNDIVAPGKSCTGNGIM